MEVDLLSKPLLRQIPPKERVTFDEFCEIIKEDQKADLINGVIYIATPPTLEHEDEFGFLRKSCQMKKLFLPSFSLVIRQV